MSVSVVDWHNLPKMVRFTTVLISNSARSSDSSYRSTGWYLLPICNRHCVSSNFGVYQIGNLDLSNYLTDSKICD